MMPDKHWKWLINSHKALWTMLLTEWPKGLQACVCVAEEAIVNACCNT